MMQDLANLSKPRLSLQLDQGCIDQGQLQDPVAAAHLSPDMCQLTPQAESAATSRDVPGDWPGALSNASALIQPRSKLLPLDGHIYNGSGSIASQWDIGSPGRQQQWMELLASGSQWDGQAAQALQASLGSLPPSKPVPQPSTRAPGSLMSQHAAMLLPSEADQRRTADNLAAALSAMAGLGQSASPDSTWRPACTPALPHRAHLLDEHAPHSSLQQLPTTSLPPRTSTGADHLTAMILHCHATFPLGTP